jgi:hypothetical protein
MTRLLQEQKNETIAGEERDYCRSTIYSTEGAEERLYCKSRKIGIIQE